MIKNLVIGSDGFVGKPLCNHLMAAGEEIIRFDIKLWLWGWQSMWVHGMGVWYLY